MFLTEFWGIHIFPTPGGTSVAHILGGRHRQMKLTLPESNTRKVAFKILYCKNYKVSLWPLVADSHGPESCSTYVILLVVYKRNIFGSFWNCWACTGAHCGCLVTTSCYRDTTTAVYTISYNW